MPVELRVFLTAAVIIDDIVAIVVIAALLQRRNQHRLSPGKCRGHRAADRPESCRRVQCAAVLVGLSSLFSFTRLGCTRRWRESSSHCLYRRSPANLKALLAQCLHVDSSGATNRHWRGDAVGNDLNVRVPDAIYAQIDLPADKLLSTVERGSSYIVLPIFALANAGVTWSDVCGGMAGWC